VLRRVLPELDELDQNDVSAAALGDLMYPHIEQAVEVCSEEAEQFLIAGPDIVPSMVSRRARSPRSVIRLRACCATHSPLGWRVTPTRYTRRVATSIRNNT
jgi:hypothetical protein